MRASTSPVAGLKVSNSFPGRAVDPFAADEHFSRSGDEVAYVVIQLYGGDG